ncbi:MAG: PQQ-like beta-propeller repeat protein [Candidatus Eremiobacteraeota bacterium]|nr:PQQ-like beta-propeller repeat protein [Candidatus Eremiobacteraeota bacterium]
MKIRNSASQNIQKQSLKTNSNIKQPLIPEDKFEPSSGKMKNLTSDIAKALMDKSQQTSEISKIRSGISLSPVVFAKSAGWKALISGRDGTNCLIKIPMSEDSDNMLVLPFKNHARQDYGAPVLINFNKGIKAFPDVTPFGDKQGFMFAKSPDKKITYLYNSNSAKIEVFDESLNKTNTIDFSSIPHHHKIRDFISTDKANYAFVSSKHFTRGFLVALDPITNKHKWTKEFDKVISERQMIEGPDGNICLAMGYYHNDDPSLHVFTADGDKVGKIPLENRVHEMTFRKDGLLIYNVDGYPHGSPKLKAKALKFSGGKSVGSRDKWGVKEDYRSFQFSNDEKSLFAVAPKKNSNAGYSLVKINTDTGKVEWKRDKYTELFIDYKVVNDEIYLLTSDEDKRNVVMTKLDSNGNTIWEDSVPSEIGEYNIGKNNCISSKGDFIFGCNDGNLYCLHPKKEGETEQTIQKAISVKNEVIQDTKNAKKEEIRVQDDFVVIGGIKLERKKRS